jgi:hypothetical protein
MRSIAAATVAGKAGASPESPPPAKWGSANRSVMSVSSAVTDRMHAGKIPPRRDYLLTRANINGVVRAASAVDISRLLATGPCMT